MSDSRQIILDRRAAATPGTARPNRAFAEVIADHGPGGQSWLVCDVVRILWGNNALNFDGDEGTARCVAASFTDVPALAGRLQKVEKIIDDIGALIAQWVRLRGTATDYDEWEAGDRRYLSEASMAELKVTNRTPATPIEETILLPELTAA